jgi:hypothetical protein
MSRTATFTLSELDLRRAVRLHVFAMLRDRRTMIRLSIVWIVGIALLVGVLLLMGIAWPELRGDLPLISLVMAVMAFGVPFLLPLALGPLVVRRRFRGDKLVRQPVTASWDEEAYQVEQPGIYNRIPWGDYSMWQEGRHLFVFFISAYSYQVLPKRVLTEEQIEDIRRVLPVQ